MARARTAMIDIYIEPEALVNAIKRKEVIESIENLLGPFSLKKQHEHFIGETLIIMYAVHDGSITSTLNVYPFGLMTLTIQECSEVSPFTNSKLDEFRNALQKQLNLRVESMPIVKRGATVPRYFLTSDERYLEYDFDKVVYEANSKFQNIKILHSPTLGNVLLLDNLQNLGETDINYTHGLMKKDILPYQDKEILILGGGDGGLLHELLKENPKFIRMVDIDEMVINACQKHLRGACGDSLDSLTGPNYEVIVDDCIKKMDEYKAEGRQFDYVINDLTDIPISQSPQGELWDFVKKILSMSLLLLKEDGHYLNHALGESCQGSLKLYEDMLSDLPTKLKFVRHSAYVPSFMENWVFYDIWKV